MKACLLAAVLAMASTVTGGAPRYVPPRPMLGIADIDPEQRIAHLRELLPQFDQRIAEIEKQLPAARKKAESRPWPPEVQQEVQDKSISHPGARQVVEARTAKHHADLQAQELELIGLQARRQAIQRAMAEQSERLKTLVKEDAISAQLQQVVVGREANLERIKKMHEAAVAPATEVSVAMGALAEARARVLERQETVADRNGGDVLTAWNRELMNLSVDAAEKEAKQQVMEVRLAAIREAWKAHQELADLESDLVRCRDERMMARDEFQHLEKQPKQPAAK